MRPLRLVLALVLAALAGASAVRAGGEERLCPEPDPREVADDGHMVEADFLAEPAARALRYLRERVPAMVFGDDPAFRDRPEFYLSYPNSVAIVEGHLLRQRALLARARLQAARAAGRDAEVAERKDASDRARRDFCAFLAQAYYVD